MASFDFSTANNPLPAPWGAGAGSPAWANLRATGGECANAAGSDTDSMMRYSASSATRSIIEYRSGTFDGGPAFMDSAGNGYLATCFSGTTVELYRVVTGANYNKLGTDALVTFAAGDIAELAIVGNDIVFYKNTVEIFRQTDTTFRSGLSPSIFEFAGNLRVDNWSDGAAADTLFAQALT